MNQTTVFKLMTALCLGAALPEAGIKSVLAVEREDGSGKCWNVTGYDCMGTKVTRFIRTIDKLIAA